MTEILEIHPWKSNAEMIDAVFWMHVFQKRWAQDRMVDVLDVTYGRGLWWTDMLDVRVEPPAADPFDRRGIFTDRPLRAVIRGHDYRHDGVDYRHLPEEDETVDVVAFDPDYIAPGGRDTSTVAEFNDRYGLKGTYETPEQLQFTINAGVREAARVVRPQGLILVKCANYVSSGKVWPGEFRTIENALNLGLVVEDIFVYPGGTGPQPEKHRTCQRCKVGGRHADALGEGRVQGPYGEVDCPSCDGEYRIPSTQQHARSNSSRLLVFRKLGRRKRSST